MPSLNEQQEAKLATARKLGAMFRRVYRGSSPPKVFFASVPARVLGHVFSLFGSPVLTANFHYGYFVAVQVAAKRDSEAVRVAFTENKNLFTWGPGSAAAAAAPKNSEGASNFLSDFRVFCEALFRNAPPRLQLNVLVHPYTDVSGLAVRSEFLVAEALKYVVATTLGGLDLKGNPRHEALLFGRMRAAGLRLEGLKNLVAASRGHVLLLDPETLQARAFDLGAMIHKPFLLWARAKEGVAPKRLRARENYAVCERAMRRIQTYFPRKRLFSELTIEDHREVLFALEPREQSVALHLLLESRSIYEATQALRQGDFVGLGASLHSSHYSYHEHFRIFDEKADFVVAFSKRAFGLLATIGLRGEVGEFVLVFAHPSKFDGYLNELKEAYADRFGEELVGTPTQMLPGIELLG